MADNELGGCKGEERKNIEEGNIFEYRLRADDLRISAAGDSFSEKLAEYLHFG